MILVFLISLVFKIISRAFTNDGTLKDETKEYVWKELTGAVIEDVVAKVVVVVAVCW
jgi:hypothetical protein